jgi:CubicO group peptidase (beta-lactamase class C family)
MSVSWLTVERHVEPQFAPVLDALVANFEERRAVGAAVAVNHRGALVVDLAAGMRDRTSPEPYSLETLQAVFSVTKGITALAANVLVDQGRLDLEAPVASYCPEFAQAGKSKIPVEWLLTHKSGVLGLDRKISLEQLLDWKFVVKLLEAQTPDWEPGSRHGYHSITFSFLVGEIIRRVTGRSVGRYVAQEIAGPLQADIFVRLPEGEEPRLAAALLPEVDRSQRVLADSGPFPARVLDWILAPLTPVAINRRDVRAAETPAANGIANARSLARMFASMLGPVDRVRSLSSEGMYRARREQWRGLDVVMGVDNAVGLGFLLPIQWCPLGGSGSFGIAGFGGSRAWANPELELDFAYLPTLCSLGHCDAREVALSRAVITSATYQSIRERNRNAAC